MKERLQERLQELEAEYVKGQQQLKDLELEAENMRATLLRISGAIQVLQEELERKDKQGNAEN